MESDEVAEREDRSPAEALASTRAARETLARRVAIPWTWDAFLATSMGIYLCLVLDPPYWWIPLTVVFWPLALVLMKRARQRRVGVFADGSTRRTADPLRWWLVVAALAVVFTGMALESRWEHARLVGAVLTAAVVFGGFRWINRRAVARIRYAA